MAVVVGDNGQKMARPFNSSIQANHIPPITDAINQESTETSGSTLHPPLKIPRNQDCPGTCTGTKVLNNIVLISCRGK